MPATAGLTSFFVALTRALKAGGVAVGWAVCNVI